MPKKTDWRSYQAKLHRTARVKQRRRQALKLATVVPIFLFLGYAAFWLVGSTACQHARKTPTPAPEAVEARQILNKREVQTLLSNQSFCNLRDARLEVAVDGHRFQIDTSLDTSLQNTLMKKVERAVSRPRYRSRHIGIVVMQPSTGRILSMVGFDKIEASNNPCTRNIFPAASIFKIVTAAAAVEKFSFTAQSNFTYNGRKHTLYKSQLKNRRNRYTRQISLQDSFAQSVNPVFGKLGKLYLKKDALRTYATAFGFNRQIDFEIPLVPSVTLINDEPYHWAEIASGFNRDTVISPVHAVLLASAILNQGIFVEPTIVDQVTDEKGQMLYRCTPTRLNRAVSVQTSKIVTRLMQATVSSGTSRKAFRGSRRDPVLSQLSIGGKTGSIDNRSHDIRYDWFAGFAQTKRGDETIAVAAVVAHEAYIGVRAADYVRLAIKQYFRDYFAKTDATAARTPAS